MNLAELLEDPSQLYATAGVANLFTLLALIGLCIRAARIRGWSTGLSVFVSLLAAPFAFIPLVITASNNPSAEVRARGGGFFQRGPAGGFSISAFALSTLVVLIIFFAAFFVGRFHYKLLGESLQPAGLLGLIVGGLVGGFVMAVRAQRIAFIEALCTTSIFSWFLAAMFEVTRDFFSFGMAPAYIAVLVAAANLILLLCLTLGGSVGYLFGGEGSWQLSWSYEQWMGRRFLMGKRNNNVVGIITVISVLGVMVGTCAMIVVMSVMNGFSSDLRSKIFGANAHLIVMKFGPDFKEYPEIANKVRTVDGITGVSPFVLNEVMVSSDVNLTGAVIKGIDTATVDQVSTLSKNIKQGKLSYIDNPKEIPITPLKRDLKEGATVDEPKDKPANNPTEQPTNNPTKQPTNNPTEQPNTVENSNQPLVPGVIIGQEMAKSLKVFVGDVINVVSPIGELGPTGPVPKARAYRVAGIFYSGMYEYDSKFVYISLKEAQNFFSLRDNITGLECRVDDIDATQRISKELLMAVGGYPYHTKDWMEMNRNLFSALKLEKIAMFIILTFIIIVASFTIAATLIMVVIEKGKEIAVLKSMGASDTSIMKVFVTYGVIIGGTGSAAGLASGLLICFLIKTFGIGLDPDVYYIEKLPVNIDSTEVAVVAIAAVLISYLATLYPSLLAARLKPVEGLRYD